MLASGCCVAGVLAAGNVALRPAPTAVMAAVDLEIATLWALLT